MSTDHSVPVSRRGLQRRKPAPLALEARIMFDGAVAAGAADAVAPKHVDVPVPPAADLGHVVEASRAAAQAASQADGRAAQQPAGARNDPDAAAATAAADARAVSERVAAEKSGGASGQKVLFVDSSIPDYQAVVKAAAPGVKVFVIDSHRDGIQQMVDDMKGMHDVASISIVSHGDSGLLLLGNGALHNGDFDQYEAQLRSIGAALQARGEILLYGCDVGAGETGRTFIDHLAASTGAVVAASTDATGDIAHGGNWNLEIATGVVASAPILDVSRLADYNYVLDTTSANSVAQLKAQILADSTNNQDDIITLTGDITFASASDAIEINITDGHKITIAGAGHKIDGANLTRLIKVLGGNVELDNLVLTNGLAAGDGGNLDSSVANGASAGGSGLGGAIYNAGTLTIVGSTITGNKASGGGGAGGARLADPTGMGGGGGGGFGAGLGGKGGSMTYGASLFAGASGTAGVGGHGGFKYGDERLPAGGQGGSTVGGVTQNPQHPGITNDYSYLAGGGSGGSAVAGSARIGGGAGGLGINAPGGAGGDAAGGIFNASTGTLVVLGSTISGNIAAAGGGGGSARGYAGNYGNDNAGAAGKGGNATGGVMNIGGRLFMDSASSTGVSGNGAGAGAGGYGEGVGNSPGANGTAFNDISTVGGTSNLSYVPPAIGGTSAGHAVNDTATVSPFAGVTLTGSDQSVKITLDSAAKGAFTSASLAAAGFSTGDGGLTYTHASGTAATVQAALRSLVFQPTANRVAVGATETTTFTIAIDDTVATASDHVTTVVATSINDAPAGLGNSSIPVVLEDAASPAGQAIGTLTGINFQDVDPGSSLGGLAVSGNTANAATQGAWQYSSDAGSHWYAVGSVSNGAALVLSASTLLRFVPVADYSGAPPSLIVRAVDNTQSGYSVGALAESRVTADVGATGGTTPFATATNTVSASVTSVNDTPSFTKGGNQTTTEDSGAQTVSGWAGSISGGPANESGQTLNFIVTNDNNALFSAQPSVDASGNLVYTGAANAHGTANVTVYLHDNGGTANGGVDTSAGQVFTITISAVNDSPTGTLTVDGASIQGSTLTAITAGIADADSPGGITFNHQWQVSADGATGWTNISGANLAAFTPGVVEAGKYVRDQASYTDGDGTLETLSSAGARVAGLPPGVTSIVRDGAATVDGATNSIRYTVTFDNSVTGVDTTDFTLTSSGSAGGAIASVTGSGNTYTVTVDNLSGTGTLRLDLNSSGTGIVSPVPEPIATGYQSGQLYTVDRDAPAISAVTVPSVPMKVGDTVTVTLTVASDGGDAYTLDSGSVAGYALVNLTRVNATTYTASFTVAEGGTDVAGTANIPLSIVLRDSANNRNTAYTTAISQANDGINAHAPTQLLLSGNTALISDGPNALVGQLSSVDGSTGETFSYAFVSGPGDTDNSAFTLTGAGLHAIDPAALGAGSRSVRLRVTDSGGNVLEKVFTIDVSDYRAPVANNDLASATEAGGAANGHAGVDPAGNVLSNDTASGATSVTGLAGGTLGTPLVGSYGSLTLDASGNYTYVVNNNNAAVQALNADGVLSESFSYTMRDGRGATASANVVITMHGANDAPAGLGNLALAAIDQGAASPPGATIGSLRGLAFVDVDAHSSLGGVAVTGNSASAATQGVWQYSTDSGGHWYAIGAVSDSAALMLSATTQVRFMPAATYSGAPPSLTVHAVDNTITTYSVGAAGETRSTTNITDPGITAISGNANTIGVSVTATATAVNDAPTFTPGADQTSAQDAGRQTVPGWAGDISAGPGETGQTVQFIVTNDNHALFSQQPSIDAQGNLVYTAAAHASGSTTVTVVLRDNGGTANGGVDTSATRTFRIVVTPASGGIEHPVVTPPGVPNGPGVPNLPGQPGIPGFPSGGGTQPTQPTLPVLPGVFPDFPPKPSIPPSSPVIPPPQRGDLTGLPQIAGPQYVPTVALPTAPLGRSVLQGPIGASLIDQLIGASIQNSVGFGYMPRLTYPSDGGFAVVFDGSGSFPGLHAYYPVADQGAAVDTQFSFQLPSNSFIDSESGAVIGLTATQVDGSALPAWLRFDAKQGKFIGMPPPGFRGEISVRVTARDAAGHKAETVFKFKVGASASAQADTDAGRVALGPTPQGAGQGGRSSLSEQLRSAAQHAPGGLASLESERGRTRT